MKRNTLILLSVAVIALSACNKKPDAGSADNDNKSKTEKVDTVPTGPDMSLAEGYQVDDDPTKEAEKIAVQITDLSRRMMKGEDVAAEQRKLDAVIQRVSDTYKQTGKDEVFQNALNAAVAKNVSALAAEVKAAPGPDSANTAQK